MPGNSKIMQCMLFIVTYMAIPPPPSYKPSFSQVIFISVLILINGNSHRDTELYYLMESELDSLSAMLLVSVKAGRSAASYHVQIAVFCLCIFGCN